TFHAHLIRQYLQPSPSKFTPVSLHLPKEAKITIASPPVIPMPAPSNSASVAAEVIPELVLTSQANFKKYMNETFRLVAAKAEHYVDEIAHVKEHGPPQVEPFVSALPGAAAAYNHGGGSPAPSLHEANLFTRPHTLPLRTQKERLRKAERGFRKSHSAMEKDVARLVADYTQLQERTYMGFCHMHAVLEIMYQMDCKAPGFVSALSRWYDARTKDIEAAFWESQQSALALWKLTGCKLEA
ncbi:hypothetical protein DFH27DRAFT_645370, partial [Peziza echinospora]